MRDGLLLDKIPRIYYGDGDVEPFLRAVDSALDTVEHWVDNLPNLVDVDTCSDDGLPYLAALIHCPLWGQNPTLWRKQLKNWAYVCRMKGTKKALCYFFDSLGLITDKIETYWRNGEGLYTVDKPEGEPYLDTGSGLWNNSKTHYFGVELRFDNNVKLTDKDLDGLPKNILEWINRVKPAHAELLKKIILNKYFEEKTLTHYIGLGIVQSGTQKIKTALPAKCTITHRAGGAVVLSGQHQIKIAMPRKCTTKLFGGGMITMFGRITIGIREGEL